MGNHPSAVVDDGQSPINTQAYTVRGSLHARAVMASTVNASAVYARRITCQHAQIAAHETLPRSSYPNPPHRNITAHTVNADAIYADEINCKTLRCYEVHVGDGGQWQAKRVEHVDRRRVGWDGHEDDQSEPSDGDDDDDGGNDDNSEHARTRAQRKKALISLGIGGAVVAGLGGAAFAFFKYKHEEKEGREENERMKEREERERMEKEKRDKGEDDRRRHDENDHHQHAQHNILSPPVNNINSTNLTIIGNFHQSSRNVRLWSDGNHCFLIADCDAGAGAFQESRLDLDRLVAATDGEFRWVDQQRGEPGNFSGQAQRWDIVAHGAAMEADLPQPDGSMQRRRLELAQRIANLRGNLVYVG